MSLWQKIPIDVIETLFGYLDINSKINLILSNETLKDVVFKEEYIKKSLVSVYLKTLKINLTDSDFNSSVLKNILRYNDNFTFDDEFFKNIHLHINTFNNTNDTSYGNKYFPNTVPCHCSSSYAFYLNGDVIILDCSNYLICALQNEEFDYNRHFSDINFFKYNRVPKEKSDETATPEAVEEEEKKTTATVVIDAQTSELKNPKAYTLVKCNVEWPGELLLYKKIKLVSSDNIILPLILNVDQIFPIFYNSLLLVSDAKSIYILDIGYARHVEEDEKKVEKNIKEKDINIDTGEANDDSDNNNNIHSEEKIKKYISMETDKVNGNDAADDNIHLEEKFKKEKRKKDINNINKDEVNYDNNNNYDDKLGRVDGGDAGDGVRCCEYNNNYDKNNITNGSNLDLTNILFRKRVADIFESIKTIDIAKDYAVVYLQISDNEHTVMYLKKSKDEKGKAVVNVIGEKKILYCERLISFNMDLGIFFYNTEFASRVVFLDYDIDRINDDVNSCIKTTLFFNKRINKAVCLSKYIYLTIRRLKLTIVKVSANSDNRLEIESFTDLKVYDDDGNTIIINDISFIEHSELVCFKLMHTNKIFFTKRLLDSFNEHEENNFYEYETSRHSEMRFYKNNSDTEYIDFFRVTSLILPVPLQINCLKFGLVNFYEYDRHVINSNTMRVHKVKRSHLNSASPYRLLNLDGEKSLKIY